uniref:TPR_REGION domain-containing protein n=1 Tax=Parastrongyloides trichosuri TaxID=131310 RepID=A0A0N4ZB98_PARTI
MFRLFKNIKFYNYFKKRNFVLIKNDKIFFKPIKILYAGSLIFAIKDFFGIEKLRLDDDPLKDMVKQAWLYTKYEDYNKAITILHHALKIAYEQKNDIVMTRIYLEMADVFAASEEKNGAENLYKLVLQRLTTVHNFSNSHPSFITTSIKLASILAAKGNIRDADIGFKHCIKKQKENVMEQEKDETNNIKALYGYALNAYAHFLIKHGGDELVEEAQMYMDISIEQSTDIFGKNDSSTLHLINNFAALCIMNNYFEIAKKYLESVINSQKNTIEDEEIVIAMYCNYAEALYHTGKIEKAINFAERALLLSNKFDKNIHDFALDYNNSLKKNEKKTYWFFF